MSQRIIAVGSSDNPKTLLERHGRRGPSCDQRLRWSILAPPGETWMDYRIWGKIHQMNPRDFFVVATAVPDPPIDKATVLTLRATTLSDANRARRRLMIALGNKIRAQGDRIVDVEDD